MVARLVQKDTKGLGGADGTNTSGSHERAYGLPPAASINRRRTRLKILYWDGSGLWVLSKRLERGTFAWPKPGSGSGGKLPLRAEALSMLMDGIDLRGAKMRPWYERD